MVVGIVPFLRDLMGLGYSEVGEPVRIARHVEREDLEGDVVGWIAKLGKSEEF